jgi:thioredoxin-related protein
MKLTYLLFLFSNVIAASWMPLAQAAGLPAVKDFTVEAKESKKMQAPILVLFMSTSCPYCEIVLQDFLLPMQRDHAYDKRVILRQIETGSNAQLIDFNGEVTTQNAFSRKLNVWGVPRVVLFDGNGQVLTTINGLLTVDYYLAYLDNAIDESQAKIKAAYK